MGIISLMKLFNELPLAKQPLLQDLLLAIIVALAFSAFIYLAHWRIEIKLLDSLLGLGALYGLLLLRKRALFIAGFFIGLLWFYWIGYSFEYYGMKWVVPLIAIGFGLIYALFFGVLAVTNEAWIRAGLLFLLSFFEPVDFNWLQPELLFIHSYFGVEKWQFSLILIALSLFILLHNRWRFAVLALLAGAISFSSPEFKTPPLSIKLVETTIPQELKWLPQMRSPILAANFQAIDKAIAQHYDLIVLPESAYPLYLNTHQDIIEQLKERSHHIAIITGALLYENEQNYNVTYFFNEGEFEIAKKMILVPFGEYVPLPDFARRWVNDTFFNGTADYQSAKHPTDFLIKGVKFRNAVCYEASCKELYYGDPAYLIVTSNNAWFTPSIEPTLQRLLIQFYANKHGSTIFHSANSAGTGIITPE